MIFSLKLSFSAAGGDIFGEKRTKIILLMPSKSPEIKVKQKLYTFQTVSVCVFCVCVCVCVCVCIYVCNPKV